MKTDQTDFLREMQRNGEAYLNAQLQMALAADQRAVALGGIFAASASVVVGFGINATASRFACMLMAGGLVVAAFMAFRAARPVVFHVPGYSPSDWQEETASDRSLDREVFEDIFTHLDRRISENDTTLKQNAAVLRMSMMVGLVSVSLGRFLGFLSLT